MSPQSQLRVRINFLRQLHAVDPFGLTMPHLREGAILEMLQLTDDEAAHELRAMKELDFIKPGKPGAVPGIIRWVINDKGREQLVDHGLIS